MVIRSDREPRYHRPAAGPPRSLGPWDAARTGPPRPPGGGTGHGGGEAHGAPRAGSVTPPAPPRGFLSGQRGPRTAALILTTGTIGSALAGLLLASGVLTPSSGGRPVGLAQTSPPATVPPGGAAPSTAAPSPVARTPSAPASKPHAPPSGTRRPESSPAPRLPAATPPPPASTPPAATPTPAAQRPQAAGPGVLRQGDTGPAVEELQERLLEVPHVYPGGDVDGRYDDEVAAAVARFQHWYGVRGDEEGVYGDDTRRALETHS